MDVTQSILNDHLWVLIDTAECVGETGKYEDTQEDKQYWE